MFEPIAEIVDLSSGPGQAALAWADMLGGVDRVNAWMDAGVVDAVSRAIDLLPPLSPDLANGLFEFGGAFALGLDVWRIYQDKEFKGCSWWARGFFTSWGFWNLYYYPTLDQWWSFSGGMAIVIVNCVWLALALYYTRREP